MNLRELQSAVEAAIKAAYDHGENPDDVVVSLQIDGIEGANEDYACATDITPHYDGNAQASGFVLQAWNEPKDVEQILKDAGYKTVSGADNVLAAIAALGTDQGASVCRHEYDSDGGRCIHCGNQGGLLTEEGAKATRHKPTTAGHFDNALTLSDAEDVAAELSRPAAGARGRRRSEDVETMAGMRLPGLREQHGGVH